MFDAAGIESVEQALGLVFPAAYKQGLLDYPFARDSHPYRWDLFGSAERIVDENRCRRQDGFFGRPWPAHHLIFGGNGAGNLYFLDLARRDSPVFEADHEVTAARGQLATVEVALSIAAWVDLVRAEEAAFEAEEQARAERRRRRTWWQVWGWFDR